MKAASTGPGPLVHLTPLSPNKGNMTKYMNFERLCKSMLIVGDNVISVEEKKSGPEHACTPVYHAH